MRTISIPNKQRRTWIFRALLLGICLLGFVLRLWFCLEQRNAPAVRAPLSVTDMATYNKLADDILNGQIPTTFYYQPFYYAVFIPAVRILLGNLSLAVSLAQAVLGACTIWLIGMLGARLFGRRTGIFAAIALAMAQFHIFYTPFALLAVLLAFLLTLLTYLTLSAAKNPTLWRWGLVGLVAGLTTLTRGNMILLVPGILILLLWTYRHRFRALAPCLPLFLALFYLPQLPFAIHNYQATGRWTGPSTAQDAVLALGNTPEAPPGIPGAMYYPPTYRAWMKEASAPGEDRVPVRQNIVQWIRREPLAFAELKFRMLLLYWNQWEIPNNVYIGQYADSAVLNLPFLLRFGIIGTLGLTGMTVWMPRSRRYPRRLLAYWIVLAHCGATLVFYVLARFRLPMVPILCVFAGAAAEELIRCAEAYQDRRPFAKRLLVWLGTTTAAACLVYAGFETYRVHLEPYVVAHARPHGVLAEMEDTWRLFDHSAPVLGRWQLQPIPEQGLRVRKDFNIPPLIAEHEALLQGIRFPVVLPQGGNVTIGAYLAHRELGRRTSLMAPRSQVQWVELTIKPVRITAPGLLRLNILCRTQSNGETYTIVDLGRRYGRTEMVRADGEELSVTGECAVETVWRKPPEVKARGD
ncbi:MAG: glycosyltransferase family 39 protein [Candidatus Pacebacteria bacterium]|nr:glycosyltransferase family 39 protein [Candidatus Paceibacterota bacterium]